MNVTLNTKKIKRRICLPNQDIPMRLKVTWKQDPRFRYTLVIYSQYSLSSKYFHEITTNIPHTTIILPYLPIIPPSGSRQLRCRLEVYKHLTPIPNDLQYSRDNFPFEFLCDNYGLKKIYGQTFYLTGEDKK